MIADDDDLRRTRERLHQAEAALDATWREVGHNPVQYKLFSDGLIDLIRSFRADIDSYLGLAPAPQAAAVTIALEGRGVSLGHTSAGLITRFVDSFRRGLQAAVEVLEAGAAAGGRRRAPWIERACDLPLLGVAPGSVQVILGQPEADGLFSEEDRKTLAGAMDILFAGLEWAATDQPEAPAALADLSPEARQAVLSIVTRLLPPLTGPVEQVAFERPTGTVPRAVRRATLDRQTRRRVREKLNRLAADRRVTDEEGVIRSVDLDTQTFVLRERPDNQPDLPCDYGQPTEGIVKEFLDCRVLVSGTLETNRANQRQRMQVEAIELIAADSRDGLPAEPPVGAGPVEQHS
jgi:hypothetical protein